MLRLLPYLIICMLLLAFSKFMSLLEEQTIPIEPTYALDNNKNTIELSNDTKTSNIVAQVPNTNPKTFTDSLNKNGHNGNDDVMNVNAINNKNIPNRNNNSKILSYFNINNQSKLQEESIDNNKHNTENYLTNTTNTTNAINDDTNDIANKLDKGFNYNQTNQTHIDGSLPLRREGIVQKEFSNTEIEILKSLRKRREEIEKKEDELSIKENTLLVLKQDLSTKIAQLQSLQDKISINLKENQAKDIVQISRLVKIYENMKPADAAKILEELQMNILLQVVENMKEQKLAPIVAAMDTQKAKELTINLANKKSVILHSN